jgi:prophage regulatory protein
MKILKKELVCEATGLSYPSIWRLEKEGRFPSRVEISSRRVGWIDSEVDEWIESRPRKDSMVDLGTKNGERSKNVVKGNPKSV